MPYLHIDYFVPMRVGCHTFSMDYFVHMSIQAECPICNLDYFVYIMRVGYHAFNMDYSVHVRVRFHVFFKWITSCYSEKSAIFLECIALCL